MIDELSCKFFDKNVTCLGDVFFNIVKISKYNGEASVEGGLSLNKYILAANWKSLCTVPQRVIKDLMVAKQLHLRIKRISAYVLVSVKEGCIKDQIFFDEQGREREEDS